MYCRVPMPRHVSVSEYVTENNHANSERRFLLDIENSWVRLAVCGWE
jgi:hypothetical protein